MSAPERKLPGRRRVRCSAWLGHIRECVSQNLDLRGKFVVLALCFRREFLRFRLQRAYARIRFLELFIKFCKVCPRGLVFAHWVGFGWLVDWFLKPNDPKLTCAPERRGRKGEA